MKNLKLLLIFFSLLGCSNLWSQKTAFINEAKLLENIPGYAVAKKETDEINQKFVAEIKAEQEALINKENELLKPYKFGAQSSAEEIKSKMSEIDRKKHELLSEEAKLLEKKIQAKQDEYSQIYKQKVGSIIDKARQEIYNYCKKNKIDVLLKVDILASTIAYYNKEMDITNIVIKNLQ